MGRLPCRMFPGAPMAPGRCEHPLSKEVPTYLPKRGCMQPHAETGLFYLVSDPTYGLLKECSREAVYADGGGQSMIKSYLIVL